MVKTVTVYCIYCLDYSKIIINIQSVLPIIKSHIPNDIKNKLFTKIYFNCIKKRTKL
jgi:hypothetical protein